MSKIVFTLDGTGIPLGYQGIDFLLDGKSTGLMQSGGTKEFDVPFGEHAAIAKMVVYGAGVVDQGASNELKFTLKQDQIFHIQSRYVSGWKRLELASATSIEFPYGCPECATQNFDKIKARLFIRRFVPTPIKGVPPFSYSCPKCGCDWRITGSSFYRGHSLFYTIMDCPHCGSHLSLYRFPGAGEEPIQRDYCMHCGFYKRD